MVHSMTDSETPDNPDTTEIPEALTAPLDVVWYTPQVKCDSCVSQSYYMVVFDTGNLYFCNHHYVKNEALIFDKAHDVVDESELFRP